MGRYVRVASTSEIPDRGAKCVEVDGRTIAVFNLSGSYYAIDDECSHAGGPLSDGCVEGDEVECPWHGARFNVKTGAACCAPAADGQATYPVRVSGDDVEVEV